MLDVGQVGAPLPRVLGRYALYDEIASGGMAVVHFGHVAGAAGFSRPVAVKRLHPQFARDPEFVSMFLDEARVAARVQHPNVVSTVDVVALDGELFLVLEYVHGESLAGLMRACRERGERLPPAVVVAILSGALAGLHAAHQATDSDGRPLCVVHRDVSPHNILVGADGVTRVLDFGVAKATVRAQNTREGQLKGKLRYMAPEQLRGAEVTRTADVYSAGVVLWEALTGDRLFSADNDAALFGQVLEGVMVPPSQRAPTLPRSIDAPVLRALSREPSLRFPTAREMAIGLETALAPASPHEVGAWVERLAGEALAHRSETLRRIEGGIGGAGSPRPARRESTATEAGPLATGALSFAAPRWSGAPPGAPQSKPGAPADAAVRSSRPPPLPGSAHHPSPPSAPPSAPPWTTAAPIGAAPASTRGPLGTLTDARAVAPPPPSAPDASPLSLRSGALPAVVGESGTHHLSSRPPTGSGRHLATVIAFAAAMAIGGVAALSTARGRTVVLAEARAGVATVTTRAATVAAVTLPTTEASTDASAEAGIEGEGATAGSDRADDATAPSVGRRRPKAWSAPSGSASALAAPAARPGDCDPPWFEDETGIRRVKRHCLP
jgi:serine/threonine-protein kinase